MLHNSYAVRNDSPLKVHVLYYVGTNVEVSVIFWSLEETKSLTGEIDCCRSGSELE